LLGAAVKWNAVGQLPPVQIAGTDESFEEGLGVEFRSEYVDGALDMEELNNLFVQVGFPRREEAKLAVALQNTYAMVWIRTTRKSRSAKIGQLLGFARATSDGVFNATIWDVAVLPAWQGTGLGRALLERLVARLVDDGINNISLFAEPAVVGLYKKLDFEVDPNNTKGMAFRQDKRP